MGYQKLRLTDFPAVDIFEMERTRHESVVKCRLWVSSRLSWDSEARSAKVRKEGCGNQVNFYEHAQCSRMAVST